MTGTITEMITETRSEMDHQTISVTTETISERITEMTIGDDH